MKDLMVDLETMGNGPTAAIVAIGACFFDPETGEIGETFSRNIDLQSSVNMGLDMDVSTIKWWMKQSDEARAAFDRPCVNLADALFDLYDFIPVEMRKTVQVWGNGAGFDNVILENALRVCEMKIPWQFWNHRDVRTIVEMGRVLTDFDPKKDFPFEGVRHDALSDAIHQAKYVSAIWMIFSKAVDVACKASQPERKATLHYWE